MKQEEFIKLIESIGFKFEGIWNEERYYDYKNYKIDLSSDLYELYDGSGWCSSYNIDDLKPLEKEFKNELRSNKLKQILK